LDSRSTHGPETQRIFALLIERPIQLSLDTLRIAAKFQLTQRERETLEFLVQGYTSKEIARRMEISPNTVKAFIRIIMIKTGTTTRSGIIGKVLALKAPSHGQSDLLDREDCA
jgi:DNA-binding CsgD family transcriptional regulator